MVIVRTSAMQKIGEMLGRLSTRIRASNTGIWLNSAIRRTGHRVLKGEHNYFHSNRIFIDAQFKWSFHAGTEDWKNVSLSFPATDTFVYLHLCSSWTVITEVAAINSILLKGLFLSAVSLSKNEKCLLSVFIIILCRRSSSDCLCRPWQKPLPGRICESTCFEYAHRQEGHPTSPPFEAFSLVPLL